MANTNQALLQRKNQQKLNNIKMMGKLRKDQLTSGSSSSYGIVTKMKGLFGHQNTARSDHYGSYASHGGYEECDNGISLGLLLTALAALAVMFYTLYTKVMNS